MLAQKLNTDMQRTNIYINKAVVADALKLSGVKTKKDIVNIALKEYVENHQTAKKSIPDLMELEGLGGFYEDYDYKALRINPHLPD